METVTKEPQSNSPLKGYLKQEILADYKIAQQSRLISKHIRNDVLTGKAKFGIESSGKELLQIALAHSFKKGDFYSGYYRDMTFMLKLGLGTPKDMYASLYADPHNDPYSAGRIMNNHFCSPLLDEEGQFLNAVEMYNVGSAVSSLAGQCPRALGLALASKKYRDTQKEDSAFTRKGNEVSILCVGDATTSEGVFFETLNAACVMQVPLVIVVQDDGYGISVPTSYQTAKGSISEALKGFQRTSPDQTGCEIHTVKAWDYDNLLKTFAIALDTARQEHTPVLVHVTECTQQYGHSTSGSHERYKPAERLAFEKEKDCLVHFEKWIIENKIASAEELELATIDAYAEVKSDKKIGWELFQGPYRKLRDEFEVFLSAFSKEEILFDPIQTINDKLKQERHGVPAHIMLLAEELKFALLNENSNHTEGFNNWYASNKKALSDLYENHLYSDGAEAAINIPAVSPEYDDEKVVNGYEVLNKFFDQLFDRKENTYAFGEDVGKIGGVNQCFAGLQAKYGESRVFDTGIREWTILGQAIGMAMRGLRPIAEIQYLDYLVYALPAMMDDLSCLRWRTNGLQKSPVIIRTRGHRLEGIWHSGSQMGMLLNTIRGIYICTPRNMTQAAGMYNTLIQSDDPAIVIEVLNGYRKKEKMPTNLNEFSVPLGAPEVLREGKDITLVTYGACVAVAEEALTKLESQGIDVELIDVQTLIPFDLESRISQSIAKTNRVIFLDEDMPGGGTGYMMQQVLEKQGAFKHLDAVPVCISATEHRPPYGDDGNYVSKPMSFDIIKACMNMMHESDPNLYKEVK